jgi:hypothetical protein
LDVGDRIAFLEGLDAGDFWFSVEFSVVFSCRRVRFALAAEAEVSSAASAGSFRFCGMIEDTHPEALQVSKSPQNAVKWALCRDGNFGTPVNLRWLEVGIRRVT